MKFLEEILNNKYTIQKKISENSISEIYLAYTNQNGKNKCSIKILNNQYISDRIEDIIRFHNEVSRITQLQNPNIEKIYELVEYDNVQYLVTEFIEGKSIYDLLNEGYTFETDKIVDIAAKVANGLGNAHKKGIIHRDLNPANIIILENNLQNPEIKVINFGISKIKEFIRIRDPGEIINTFCYKSPEECGVLDRNVEESSDLYSLGIIMYHLLTGILPYRGDTVNSIIHQHIARVPEPPISLKRNIPHILSDIVLKLIEKEPGRRYQSTKGLIRDLGHYKEGKTNFSLGLEDEIIHISYKTNLIGREKEFGKLKNALDRANFEGKGSICIVLGQSGLGKSRLVNELIELTYSYNKMHISGRCFTGENKIPYAPFKEALNQYLMKFLFFSEEKRNHIRKELNGKIAGMGRIITELMPEMQEIIGETPELVDINDKERENARFLLAFSRLFFYLSEMEEGLVVYIDDLQWADEGSFELLMEILKDVNNYPLLFLCTSRDDELKTIHGLNTLIKQAAGSAVSLDLIKLDYFSCDNMNDYISSILHKKKEETVEIAEFIHNKSKGNPFFAMEILKQLINEKVIYYKDEKWIFKKNILDRLQISSAVIEVVLKRISLLNTVEKDIISYAAIIGREFEISLLFLLCDYARSLIIEVVDKAISLHLMEYEIQDKKKIFFVHERVKEAFYEIIPDEQRKALHIRVARSLENTGSRNEDALFDLAYHYICGDHENKILEYAYPAGIKAKNNYAYDEAEKYFIKALNVLERKNFTGSGLWIEVTRKLAEVYLVIGNYDKGIVLITSILPYLNETDDRAAVYKKVAEAYYKKGDNDKCEESGKNGLAFLGEKLPVRRVSVLVGIVRELLVHILHIVFPVFFVRKYIKNPPEKVKSIISFYVILNWMYILADTPKFLRSILRMLNLSENRLGVSRELGVSISGYAALCMAIPLFKRSLKYHQKGLVLKREINDEYGIAQSLQFLGFCYEWMGKYKNAIHYFERSAEIFRKIGDIKEYGTTLLGIATSSTYLADYPAGENVLKIHSLIAAKSGDAYAICVNLYNMARIHFEKGLIKEAEKAALSGYEQSLANEIWFLRCCHCLVLCEITLEKGNYKQAVRYLEEAKELHRRYHFLISYIGFLYPLLAECYIVQYSQEKDFALQRDRNLLYRIKRATGEALARTRNWAAYYGASLLAYAKYCVLTGKMGKAEKYFVASIKHNEKRGRLYEKARSVYEYGLFLRQQGSEVEAVRKFRWAYQIFMEIKADHYIRKIDMLLGLQNKDPHSMKSRFIGDQRFALIIEVNQDIGSTLRVDVLQSKILQKAIEITGAQRGYLFIVNEETEKLEIVVANPPVLDTIPHTVMELVLKTYKSDQSIIFRGTEGESTGSMICAPLRHEKKIIGVCFLDNKLSNAVFSEEDMGILEIIMTQAAICIRHARLYEKATTDGLTRLYIHRHFQHLLELEVKRSLRYDRHCCLIMIDIDYFKLFNDQYGHQIGDKVLVAVAEIIKSHCRETDMACRYGGEEFCIILPEATSENAWIVAEKIREDVAKFALFDQDAEPGTKSSDESDVTISLGIAEVPIHARSKDELIKAADTALYKAKKEGRNRIVVYGQ